MSAINQQQLSIRPGSAWQNSALLSSNEKVGRASLRFHNHNSFNRLSTPISSPALLFRLAESDDAQTWTALHSAPVIVRSGAEETLTVSIRKKFVRIQSKSGLAAARAIVAEADDDKITLAAHGFIVGDRVIFSELAGGTGLTDGYEYFVKAVASSSTFTVTSAVALASTAGGTVADITVDYTSGYVQKVGGGTGGFAKVDCHHSGRVFQGQIEFVPWGKSGYGFDGQAGEGVQNYTASTWPDGQPA